MSEWKRYQISELGKVVTGKTPPTKDKENFGNEYPFITPVDMNGQKTIYKTERNLSEIGKNKVKNFLLPKDAVCISCIGSDLGKVVKTSRPSLTNQQINSIICNDSFDSDFVFYSLKLLSPTLKSIGHQSTAVPIINKTDFSKFEIDAPENKKTQQHIASILSSLDDAIELNQQINKTLEEMAKAIFKEWFVDFNFPNATGKFQETEIGKIPVGWQVGKLGDIVETKGGTTPSTTKKEYWDGEYYWTSPRDLSNLQTNVLLDTSKKITALGLKQISSGILPKGTLLLSSRAPIGYLAVSEVPISINQGFIAINGTKVSNLFMLYWLKENMQTIINNANGSTFLEISKTVFRSIPIAIPSSEVLEKFEEIISSLYNQILNNEKENQSLMNLRDTLLPKLMKGEIEIREKETV